MRQATRIDHEAGIRRAVRLLLDSLDVPMDSAALAAEAWLSKFHFHRMFQALTLETPGEMSRRLRLERAAWQLHSTKTPITEIAFDAGYATHEAFIRAFRSAFSSAPSEFRRQLVFTGELPTPNGVHFRQRQQSWRIATHPGENTMKVEIRSVPDAKAAVMSHRGPYFLIGQTFGKFAAWAAGKPNLTEGVAFYYDDPSTVAPEDLRSHAGQFVHGPVEVSDGVELIDVPGGDYAVGTYIGAYDGLGQAWNEFYGVHLAGLGRELGDMGCFEVYIDDHQKVAIDQLRTELWVKLK